jgi:hypothetical protein
MGRRVSLIAFLLFLVEIVIVWFPLRNMKQVPPAEVHEQGIATHSAPHEVHEPESRPESTPILHSFGSSR